MKIEQQILRTRKKLSLLLMKSRKRSRMKLRTQERKFALRMKGKS